jgi:hypothetical protein
LVLTIQHRAALDTNPMMNKLHDAGSGTAASGPPTAPLASTPIKF